MRILQIIVLRRPLILLIDQIIDIDIRFAKRLRFANIIPRTQFEQRFYLIVAFEAVPESLFLLVVDILPFYDELCAFGAEDISAESAVMSPTNYGSELFVTGKARAYIFVFSPFAFRHQHVFNGSFVPVRVMHFLLWIYNYCSNTKNATLRESLLLENGWFIELFIGCMKFIIT